MTVNNLPVQFLKTIRYRYKVKEGVWLILHSEPPWPQRDEKTRLELGIFLKKESRSYIGRLEQPGSPTTFEDTSHVCLLTDCRLFLRLPICVCYSVLLKEASITSVRENTLNTQNRSKSTKFLKAEKNVGFACQSH